VTDEEGLFSGGFSLQKQVLTDEGLSPREIAELREVFNAPDIPDFELDLSTMRPAEDVAREMQEAVPDIHLE